MACKGICPTTIAMGLLAAGGIGYAGYSMFGGECSGRLDDSAAVTTVADAEGSSCSTTMDAGCDSGDKLASSCDSGVTLASSETDESCPMSAGSCGDSEGAETLASMAGQDALTLVKAETATSDCATKADCETKSDCETKTDCAPSDCTEKTECESEELATTGG